MSISVRRPRERGPFLTRAVAEKTDDKPSRRDPEGHRQVLIDATLDLIAEIGVPETTVSRIIERAELSRGMIHLHFGGKDKLLIAAAQAFSAAHQREMERQLAEAGPAPADRVIAAVRADLSEVLLNERTARLWHAFRGIANPDPEIAHYCGTRDGLVKDTISVAFRTLAEADQRQDAERLVQDATFGTMALLEGLCVDYLSNQSDFSRDAAERVVLRFLGGLFPNHFKVET